jgi:hypothetical protein
VKLKKLQRLARSFSQQAGSRALISLSSCKPTKHNINFCEILMADRRRMNMENKFQI